MGKQRRNLFPMSHGTFECLRVLNEQHLAIFGHCVDVDRLIGHAIWRARQRMNRIQAEKFVASGPPNPSAVYGEQVPVGIGVGIGPFRLRRTKGALAIVDSMEP